MVFLEESEAMFGSGWGMGSGSSALRELSSVVDVSSFLCMVDDVWRSLELGCR